MIDLGMRIRIWKALNIQTNNDTDKFVDDLISERESLLRVYRAAKGLCGGQDWNKGNHAITHGYRQQLIDSVSALEEKGLK